MATMLQATMGGSTRRGRGDERVAFGAGVQPDFGDLPFRATSSMTRSPISGGT